MDGPGGRERAGLPGNRGPQMVVTDLGIMKFDEETKRMYLAYYYPYSSPEMVQGKNILKKANYFSFSSVTTAAPTWIPAACPSSRMVN